MIKEEEKKVVKEDDGLVEIKPLRDFRFQFDKIYDLKKGEKVKLPKVLLQNLKTEKVIK